MTNKNARVIVITSQKGGVSKTTTASALADGLHIKRYKSLLIDLDPQCSASLISGADTRNPYTIYEAITKQITALQAIQARNGRADVLPASKALARLDAELTATGKEYKLREAIAPLLNIYDYIIIDTPPSLGILTINALTTATSVLIPTQADILSLQGITQLIETIDAVKAYTNPGLVLAGVLLTRHNARSILSKDMSETAQETANQIGTFLYKSTIRETVAIKESQALKQSIFTYAPKSNAATDYDAFVSEFLERGQV